MNRQILAENQEGMQKKSKHPIQLAECQEPDGSCQLHHSITTDGIAPVQDRNKMAV